MTLLDAPKFDEARERRKRIIVWSSVAGFFTLVILWWFLAGRPIDWPWNWNNHLFGRMAVNHFMDDLEKNDLKAAYGVWMHDPKWEQHPDQHKPYSFARFSDDWSPTSPDAEYHQYRTHRIAAARMYGNVLLVAILMNGAKQDALDLTWDPRTRELSYPPPGVKLSTVPFGNVP